MFEELVNKVANKEN